MGAARRTPTINSQNSKGFVLIKKTVAFQIKETILLLIVT